MFEVEKEEFDAQLTRDFFTPRNQVSTFE